MAFEVWGAPWETSWFNDTNRDSPEVAELIREHADLVEFQCWLQWIADEQVSAAQQIAKNSGMALGLMQDMAVGVHSLGADVWWNPERFAVNPNYLNATGYGVYRDMVHTMFAHAGAVRIDHVLGLFRLWWIPQGEGAKNGAYVTYNVDAMIAILTIEASRVDGLVDASPNAGDPYDDPTNYRKYALASVTTHDLPPTAGYLQFEHVQLRERLHLLTESVESFQASATAERQAMLNRLRTLGLISDEEADDADSHIPQIVEAMHAMLRKSPSLLIQAALVDGVGERRTQNQPGTSDQYPNWRIPLADEHGRVVHTDEVFDLPRVKSLAAIMDA